MRLISLALFALISFASMAYAHPVSECLAPIEESNGFFQLGNILYIIGTVIALAAVLIMYFWLGLPVFLLRFVLLGLGLYPIFGEPSGFLALSSGFWAFLSAICLGGFVLWQFYEFVKNSKSQNHMLFLRIVALICLPIWIYITFAFQSSVVGFMTVAAIAFVITSFEAFGFAESALGFPGVKFSGRATMAGAFILVLYLVSKRLSLPVELFRFGALYISSLVLNTSLLINTWGSLRAWGWQRIIREALFLGFAFLAMFYGDELGSEVLVKMGGTFLALWLATKVINLVSWLYRTFNNIGFASLLTITLGLGIIYGGDQMMTHADVLRQYMYLP